MFIHLIVLDHAELEQCKSEQVEVDLAEHPLPVHYGICDDPNRKCFQQHNESCEPEQEFETIIKAKLVDHNGNSHRLHLHNDRKGFDVRRSGHSMMTIFDSYKLFLRYCFQKMEIGSQTLASFIIRSCISTRLYVPYLSSEVALAG